MTNLSLDEIYKDTEDDYDEDELNEAALRLIEESGYSPVVEQTVFDHYMADDGRTNRMCYLINNEALFMRFAK